MDTAYDSNHREAVNRKSMASTEVAFGSSHRSNYAAIHRDRIRNDPDTLSD
jgi:hypothetical protein